MSFQIKQSAPDQLRVELFGQFDAKVAEALERELSAALAAQTPGAFCVLFNTVGLIECAMDARPVLVRIQKAVATKARRTAYVDDRARFRGLALWVMHLAQDDNAKAVVSPEMAKHWFSAAGGRAQDAERRAEVA